ncbi:unnamed protein product, partial [Adineta steineri]
MACLAQVNCKVFSFHKSSSSCELFAAISNQNGSLLANPDTITMIVMDGTRIPLEPNTTSTTPSATITPAAATTAALTPAATTSAGTTLAP